MNGQRDGARMDDGWIDGWTAERIDGWTAGQIDEQGPNRAWTYLPPSSLTSRLQTELYESV